MFTDQVSGVGSMFFQSDLKYFYVEINNDRCISHGLTD